MDNLAQSARLSHAASIASRNRPVNNINNKNHDNKYLPPPTVSSTLNTTFPISKSNIITSSSNDSNDDDNIITNYKPTSSIIIKNFKIDCWKYPILNENEIKNFEKILNFPIPEMIFGNNKISISNDDKFNISFNALDALKLVNHDDLIKVSYSNDWINNKLKNNINNIPMNIHNPFNWTYETLYNGSINSGNNWKIDTNDSIKIPIEKLSINNKIKFFIDLPLFEDELADNGISSLNVKIRVMDNCLLLLQRLFIRVDDVLLKIIDTRLFIDFIDNLIINEQKIKFNNYKDILNIAKLESNNDPKKLLRDIQWCCDNLNLIESKRLYMNI